MYVCHHILPRSYLVDQLAAVGVAVDVTPAVTVADPEKLLPVVRKEEVVVNPCKKVEDIDPPHVRLLLHDQLPLPAPDVVEPELKMVLMTVQIDQRQAVVVRSPVDPGDVAIAHIVIDPALIPALYIHHTNPDIRILLSHLRVGEVGVLRILPLVIGRDEPLHMPLITLPVGDVVAVGGPLPGLNLSKLLLVDPAEPPVEEILFGIEGELPHVATRQIVDKEFAVPPISDLRSIG